MVLEYIALNRRRRTLEDMNGILKQATPSPIGRPTDLRVDNRLHTGGPHEIEIPYVIPRG